MRALICDRCKTIIPTGTALTVRGTRRSSLFIIGHFCSPCYDWVRQMIFTIKEEKTQADRIHDQIQYNEREGIELEEE